MGDDVCLGLVRSKSIGHLNPFSIPPDIHQWPGHWLFLTACGPWQAGLFQSNEEA